DEATSSMSESSADRFFKRLIRLRDQGVAILLISHRLQEVYAVASHATVLRDGHLVDTLPIPAASEHELVRRMVGRPILDLFGKRHLRPGPPVLDVSDLSATDGSIRDASFTVHAGEIVAVAGLVGSGKTELALALAGCIPARGVVRVDG